MTFQTGIFTLQLGWPKEKGAKRQNGTENNLILCTNWERRAYSECFSGGEHCEYDLGAAEGVG